MELCCSPRLAHIIEFLTHDEPGCALKYTKPCLSIACMLYCCKENSEVLRAIASGLATDKSCRGCRRNSHGHQPCILLGRGEQKLMRQISRCCPLPRIAAPLELVLPRPTHSRVQVVRLLHVGHEDPAYLSTIQKHIICAASPL